MVRQAVLELHVLPFCIREVDEEKPCILEDMHYLSRTQNTAALNEIPVL